MGVLNQKFVLIEDLSAFSGLLSVDGSARAVLGPAIGGWLLSGGGLSVAYGFYLAIFFVALLCALRTKSLELPLVFACLVLIGGVDAIGGIFHGPCRRGAWPMLMFSDDAKSPLDDSFR